LRIVPEPADHEITERWVCEANHFESAVALRPDEVSVEDAKRLAESTWFGELGHCRAECVV